MDGESHEGLLLATEWNTNTAEWLESFCRFLQLLYFISFCTTISEASCQTPWLSDWLYSAQVRGDITFSLTYLLQLRLCFENFLINLESILSPGLFLLRNQMNILVCKKCSFPTGSNRGFLAEHLVCKNVQPWLKVSFANTSQPSLYFVPYSL